MKQDWNANHASVMERVGAFAAQNPELMQGLMTMDGAAAKSGHLTPVVHELIALAVAVTTRCDGCITVHTKKAVEYGATLEQVSEALGVAITLNAGAALTYSSRVIDAYTQQKNA